ncbi:hypothetical protein J1605_002365 [Eschrichtius robustus]|uniref:Uncharacterized protein n=1 Tax=Eschrichtius robustus TaxID=9764 RepID=A0AB34HTU9_ESCRO|nr:hypothetical protein J1605_002365 [Eschrichtius robustus]
MGLALWSYAVHPAEPEPVQGLSQEWTWRAGLHWGQKTVGPCGQPASEQDPPAHGQRPGGWRALCQAWPLPQSKRRCVNSVLSPVAPALDPIVGNGVQAAGNGAGVQNAGRPPGSASGCGWPLGTSSLRWCPAQTEPMLAAAPQSQASPHRRTSTPRTHLLTVYPPSSSCPEPGRLSGREPQAGSRQTAHE